MSCVFRCGFSLIFERGLEKDICLHGITQKSTWSGLGRLDRHHLLYDTRMRQHLKFWTATTKEDRMRDSFEIIGFLICKLSKKSMRRMESAEGLYSDKCDGIQSDKNQIYNCNQFNLVKTKSAQFSFYRPAARLWIYFKETPPYPHPPFPLGHSPPVYPHRPRSDTYREIRAAT